MGHGSSPLVAMGASSLEALQRQFRLDPASVDPGWRVLFEVLEEVEPGGDIAGRAGDDGNAVAARLADAIRARGHLYAWVCPLEQERQPLLSRLKGSEPPAQAPGLSPEALERLYGGTLTIETAHIDAAEARAWLVREFEAGAGDAGPEEKRAVLGGLIAADEFERFLGVKYPTKKRFGAEGAEAVVPLLRRLLEEAAASGVTHAVVGTMHRGRLSLMANVLGKDLTRMLAEIKGMHPLSPSSERAGDVPYHLGLETTLEIAGRQLRVTLLANPSHLEAIDPLVLGRARALQDLKGEEGKAKVLPIILHTDAAVIGQGVVPETLQLGGTAGFGTGGTVHVVINNRIGFTTEERDARTSTHCTGAWKAVDSAILHVNADDPLAVCRAAELAFGYRRTQGRDAVIDLVCYRRNGHNEIDEPTFTQPVLYQRIAAKEPVASAFAARLVAEGILTEEEVTAERGRHRDGLQAAYERASEYRPNSVAQAGAAPNAPAPETGAPAELLRSMAARLAEGPEGMALHPRMGRVLKQRLVTDGGQVSWPVAEALAFGSLLTEGVPIRLTGQDVVRGAFSHRHFGLFDTGTGEMHLGLNGLAEGQARFSVHNSPLSEYAVLGFEYGYSLARPDVLTLWEAQFGDFANGAQIIIDQFVISAEEKWGDRSGLVMLLPHGLEGQGPEHSSARPERYLQMAAKDNVRIVNPSTPANYFHLLREQALGSSRRPLIVMSPKKLLRLPAAVSSLEDFAPGRRFLPVVTGTVGDDVGLVLFCSGKIAYELEEEIAQQGHAGAVVVRLEQLYPFPAEILADLAQRWPDARCCWVQEEPENMGAWAWVRPRLEAVFAAAGLRSPQLAYVGRPESPSPAGSFHGDHDADQRSIVERACAAAPSARATKAA